MTGNGVTGHGRERGQALVEFAFSVSLFFLLIFAAIDFGRALNTYDLLAQGARIGTRWAMVNTPKPPSDCSVPGGVCQQGIINAIVAKTSLDTSRLTDVITYGGQAATCASQPTPQCYVVVQLSYRFNFTLLPLPAQTFTSSSQITLTSQ